MCRECDGSVMRVSVTIEFVLCLHLLFEINILPDKILNRKKYLPLIYHLPSYNFSSFNLNLVLYCNFHWKFVKKLSRGSNSI